MRIATLIAAALVLLGSCSKEDEDVLLKQKERMISYLESTHNPRLVAEEAIEEGVDQPFYTIVGDGAYRYIDGFYNPDRPNRKEVTADSKVTITFSAYLFNFTNITTDGSRITLPYFSNNPLYEELFYRPTEEGGAGLTPGAWSFEPLVIDLKSAAILEGLRLALIGCRERDRVEAFMTFNMAYGDHYLNIIGKEQPIAYFFTIDAVE